MWKYTAPCVNPHKRKYTFPHGEIHIKLLIPHSVSTKRFRIISSKKKTKQNFCFAYNMFPCFMSRFGNVYLRLHCHGDTCHDGNSFYKKNLLRIKYKYRPTCLKIKRQFVPKKIRHFYISQYYIIINDKSKKYQLSRPIIDVILAMSNNAINKTLTPLIILLLEQNMLGPINLIQTI